MIMIQVALNVAMSKRNKAHDALFNNGEVSEAVKPQLKKELLKANAEIKALEVELEGIKKAAK